MIVTCVRFYLRFSLSLRDVRELMAERGPAVDHTSVWRWVQAYGPEVCRRLQGAVKRKSSTWHMDETFVRIGGRQMYLFWAVDSGGQTVDNGDNRPPHVFGRDGLRSYPAAIRELQGRRSSASSLPATNRALL